MQEKLQVFVNWVNHRWDTLVYKFTYRLLLNLDFELFDSCQSLAQNLVNIYNVSKSPYIWAMYLSICYLLRMY